MDSSPPVEHFPKRRESLETDSKNAGSVGIRQFFQAMKPCKRCGKRFKPTMLKAIRKKSTCCEMCQVRNVLDGLGMATPPALLDRHTRRPMLTDEAWRKEMERTAP